MRAWVSLSLIKPSRKTRAASLPATLISRTKTSKLTSMPNLSLRYSRFLLSSLSTSKFSPPIRSQPHTQKHVLNSLGLFNQVFKTEGAPLKKRLPVLRSCGNSPLVLILFSNHRTAVGTNKSMIPMTKAASKAPRIETSIPGTINWAAQITTADTKKPTMPRL